MGVRPASLQFAIDGGQACKSAICYWILNKMMGVCMSASWN
jgi:hypothetical protein